MKPGHRGQAIVGNTPASAAGPDGQDDAGIGAGFESEESGPT